jgi:ParB family transcriptional regulator, chromosome partitioning protein
MEPETEHFIKERKYFDLFNGEIEKRNYKSVISSDEIEYLSSKFTGLYKEDVKIKASRSGRIRLLIEFENIQKTYDYLKSKLSSDWFLNRHFPRKT